MPSLLVIKKLAAALETTMASLMRELEKELAAESANDNGQAAPRPTPARKQSTKSTRSKSS
jgi:hypothetical protein